MSNTHHGSEDSELYSISQVNALTGVATPTLRKWENAFRDYLKVARTSGGQRRFDEDAIRKIETLKRLIYEEGLSLQGARKRLEELEARVNNASSSSPANIEKLSEMVTDMLIEKLFRNGFTPPMAGKRLDDTSNENADG
jgi:DNA-binding transcriptional MerR regulator